MITEAQPITRAAYNLSHLNPRNGIGIHATSSYRGDIISEQQKLDPKHTSPRTVWALRGDKGICYFHLRNSDFNNIRNDSVEAMLKKAAEWARQAVRFDLEDGIVSHPELLIFESPARFSLFGKTIIPASTTPFLAEDRILRKPFLIHLLGRIPLPEDMDAFSVREEWGNVLQTIH